MNADDRELIEHTRKINKTLSMFVFALQEDADISVDGQLDIANLLDGLAETVRARAARQQGTGNGGRVTDLPRLQPSALEPGHQTDKGT